MRDGGVNRGGGTGRTALAWCHRRRAPSANVTGLAPATTLVHTQSQGGGDRGEGGMEMTPPGARPIMMGSQDADMTMTKIVMVVLLQIRILASLSSLVVNDDDANVRTRMGGQGAWGHCRFCLSVATLPKE